ncbi:hypothetical protein [Paenibacillus sp. sgz302251]|uniref:hypothetical protein n=1 Tax=Paenibacillus sp. sgz302251 TaxID=3414493 RepID=UPI003C7CF40C
MKMKNSNLRKRVVWFINAEIDRILLNLKSGAVNKEHALGSLNTLYQVASTTKDSDSMTHLCKIIEKIRYADHKLGIYQLPEMRRESSY